MALGWQEIQLIEARVYRCGYCGAEVGSDRGYQAGRGDHRLYLCPVCDRPTFFDAWNRLQVPGVPFGGDVEFIPPESAAIYREARNCMTVDAYTAVVLLCRKLLMHIAVAEGAKEKDTFAAYVEYLITAGYVAPKSRGWVDRVRTKSNEANHEIAPITRADAEELITLSQMILRLVYELPGQMPPP